MEIMPLAFSGERTLIETGDFNFYVRRPTSALQNAFREGSLFYPELTGNPFGFTCLECETTVRKNSKESTQMRLSAASCGVFRRRRIN